MASSSLPPSKYKLPVGPFSVFKCLKLCSAQNQSIYPGCGFRPRPPSETHPADAVHASLQFPASIAHPSLHSGLCSSLSSLIRWVLPLPTWHSMPTSPRFILFHSIPSFSITPLTVCWLKHCASTFYYCQKNYQIIHLKRAKVYSGSQL